MNKLAFMALWLLVFSIPWSNLVVFAWGATITRVIGMTAFGICALAVVATGNIRRLKASHFIIAAFIAWAIASYFWSLAPDRTLQIIWTYVQLFAMVWLIWQFSPRESQLRNLMQAYVWGAYLSIASVVINFLFGQQAFALRYSPAGFNPNDIGIILSLAIPMSWYLALVKRGKMVWLNRLCIPLSLFAILLTASRTSFILALFALIIIPWTFSRLSLRMKLVSVLAVILCAFVLYSFVPSSSWQRLATAPTEITQGTVGNRIDIWQAGLTLVSEHPILGVGSGAFPQAVEPILGMQRVAHNTFLSVLAENGIVGLALFCLIGFLCILSALRMRALERKVWLILLGSWVVGVFFFTYEFQHVTWLLLGLSIAHGHTINDPVTRTAPLDGSFVAKEGVAPGN
jgi:O-antigen ligase